MPLTMARTGDTNSIKKVGGKDDVRRFLESLLLAALLLSFPLIRGTLSWVLKIHVLR